MSAVVLVHGAAMDGTVWRYQADALAREGFSPIAVDLPGHGDSEGEPSLTIKGYAGWLLAYLSVLDEPVHLVGHSMGALVVLEAAAARPDRVRSVTLLGVADRMPVNPALLTGLATNDLTVFTTMVAWMHAREPIGASDWQIGDTVAILQRSRPGIAFADLTACNDYPGAAGAVANAHMPLLLILGDQDLMTKPSGAEPIANAARDATTVVVEGAGHMLMVERPDVVNEALMEFLRSVAE
ncbi:MAG: alpha/beta hydrolase [Actinomycetota bacterium]|nr:alpha/beta hydrolase [Actinomycetota bacterium]